MGTGEQPPFHHLISAATQDRAVLSEDRSLAFFSGWGVPRPRMCNPAHFPEITHVTFYPSPSQGRDQALTASLIHFQNTSILGSETSTPGGAPHESSWPT